MSNPAIPRKQVHELAEACSEAGSDFQPIATRLLKSQRRLTRFIEHNAEPLGPRPAEVAVYMTSVCLRVFEQVGGQMRKVSGRDLDLGARRIQQVVPSIMPPDLQLPQRVRKVEWRAQPHLLDEILWALFEKEETEEGEVRVEPPDATMIFLAMWTVVEALDRNWRPPPGYEPSDT